MFLGSSPNVRKFHGCFGKFPGRSGKFRVFLGSSGCFWKLPGVFGKFPGCFWKVPGVFGKFSGCFGKFRHVFGSSRVILKVAEFWDPKNTFCDHSFAKNSDQKQKLVISDRCSMLNLREFEVPPLDHESLRRLAEI